MLSSRLGLAALIAAACGAPALAQDDVPAKVLFGRMAQPADLESRSIGSYARGCLAGANPLPLDGPTWQVMRLSRNRNWGMPILVAFIEKFATDAHESRRLAGPPGRRHVAAARRADDLGPRQPPDRPRRRHLVRPDAALRHDAARSARIEAPPPTSSPAPTPSSARTCGPTPTRAWSSGPRAIPRSSASSSMPG